MNSGCCHRVKGVGLLACKDFGSKHKIVQLLSIDQTETKQENLVQEVALNLSFANVLLHTVKLHFLCFCLNIIHFCFGLI